MTRSDRHRFGPGEHRNATTLIALARAEDLGEQGDITSNAVIPGDAMAMADLVAREPGVLAGLPVLGLLIDEFSLGDRSELLKTDGDTIAADTVIARIAGPLRSILAFERTALNFLQRLSGIATLTARFVDAVAGTRARILDTRKMTPGWRALEKYAVRCGGGDNHRIGLYDAVLIKDNHLDWLLHDASVPNDTRIAHAIKAARQFAPAGVVIEVEVDNLEQLDEALAARPDIILVDNLGREPLLEAVRRRNHRAPAILLEASGGINLATVAAIASSGVDRISVGALTHSAPALDLALDLRMSINSS
jgi:nicotinate-nucleotide pyrophosphorylase (carboxylating)